MTPSAPIESNNKLYNYLLDTGTTQKWLADKCGVSTETVLRWTRGYPISQPHRKRLREVLNERAEIDIHPIIISMPIHTRHNDAAKKGSGSGTPYDRLLRGEVVA